MKITEVVNANCEGLAGAPTDGTWIAATDKYGVERILQWKSDASFKPLGGYWRTPCGCIAVLDIASWRLASTEEVELARGSEPQGMF